MDKVQNPINSEPFYTLNNAIQSVVVGVVLKPCTVRRAYMVYCSLFVKKRRFDAGVHTAWHAVSVLFTRLSISTQNVP
jgi:hypothetical protein